MPITFQVSDVRTDGGILPSEPAANVIKSFHGGFVGVRQAPQTREVTPQLGWAVEDLSDC